MFAAGIGADNRVEIPAVGHLVVIFHKHHAGFGGFPGGFDNGMPYVTGFDGFVYLHCLALGFPLVQVAVPYGIVFAVRGIREHQIPIQILLYRLHKAVADAHGEIGVGDLVHGLFDGDEVQQVRMPVVHHQHQGSAPASALLDEAGGVAEQPAPRHSAGGRSAYPTDDGPAGTQG
ncbi:hypothetical protein D3C75_863520 [compost metagenome]